MVGYRRSVYLRNRVAKLIEEMPIGYTFTTEEIYSQVKYSCATARSVALAIRYHHNVENTVEHGMAIWRKIE